MLAVRDTINGSEDTTVHRKSVYSYSEGLFDASDIDGDGFLSTPELLHGGCPSRARWVSARPLTIRGDLRAYAVQLANVEWRSVLSRHLFDGNECRGADSLLIRSHCLFSVLWLCVHPSPFGLKPLGFRAVSRILAPCNYFARECE